MRGSLGFSSLPILLEIIHIIKARRTSTRITRQQRRRNLSDDELIHIESLPTFNNPIAHLKQWEEFPTTGC